MTRDEALKLRALIEQAILSLTDKEASEGALLFPRLKQDNSLIEAGVRINWNGDIKRAASDLWDTEENNPDNAPALWEDISYKKGYRIIPSVITSGTAFAEGELGWWNDVLYKSLLPNNVWNPTDYPQGWKAVAE